MGKPSEEKTTDPARTLFGREEAHAGQISTGGRASVVAKWGGQDSGSLTCGLLIGGPAPVNTPVHIWAEVLTRHGTARLVCDAYTQRLSQLLTAGGRFAQVAHRGPDALSKSIALRQR